MTLPPEPEEKLPAQPFVEHLIELRSRLLRALVVIVLMLFGLMYFSNDIYDFVAEPLLKHLPVDSNSSMIVTDVTAAFLTPFKLTFFVAVFVSMPFLLYQLWAFVAPALYQNEKSLALPIFISSVILFYTGVAFAYYIVFPMLFEFFTSVAPDSVTVMPDITSHLNLVIKLFFAFGFAFEIPVATVILVVAGIISPEGLAQKRPYVIVGCFVVGMLLTPPDVLSQTMLAVPMWMLFEVGLFCGRFLTKNRRQHQAEEEQHN
jgi:sec-independent protein translocase protein TatC